MKRKVIAALLMTMSLTVGSAGSVFAMSADKYADVPANSKVFDAVATVTDKSIVKGVSDTEYGIEENVTRGEFVSALYNMKMNLPVTGTHEFTDIEGREDTAAIKWADDMNLFDGLKDDFFQDNKFEPDKDLTREEASVILYNYGKAVDSLDMSKGVGVITGFDDTDSAPVSSEYETGMKWAVGNDMIIGDDLLTDEAENSLRPTEVLNKSELAEMLTQYIELRNDQKQQTADASKVATGAVNKATSTTSTKVEGNTASEREEATVSNDTTVEEPTHVHNWQPNMVTEDKEEVGHWEQELVKEAYDEEVNHPAEYKDVWVVDKEAVYNTVHHEAETHEEQQWVVDKEAVYDTVHHEAETHVEKQWVVDKEAWTEPVEHPAEYEQQWVVDQEAWDEPVYETHDICFTCRDQGLGNVIIDGQAAEHQIMHAEKGETCRYGNASIQVDTIHHEEEGHYEDVLVNDAWTEYIEHEEEGHWEDVTVVDKEAWDEPVLVSPEEGHYETVTVVDKEAYDEEVLVSPEEGHWEKELVKEAWTETVHHDAEYKDVWVVDEEATTVTVQDGMICINCGVVDK